MNKVLLNSDGLIEQIYQGKQTFQTILRVAARTMLLTDQLKVNKKRVRIIVDIGKISSVSADALLAAANALNDLPEAKIAAFGGKPILHKFAALVIAATRRQNSVKVFKTRAEAQKWLRK